MADSNAVSLIATVYNEGPNIGDLLHSIAGQSRQPDELIIVDGGSTDDTVERIRATCEKLDLPLVLVEAPGANISEGRNMAIKAAAGPYIASTDAGVELSPKWLAALVTALDSGEKIASGFFRAAPQSVFETALGAATLPVLEDINPAKFLPSSRSIAFHKSAWQTAGGYPEWLDYCEDLIFDFRMIAAAGSPGFVPEAIAYFRPRASLKQFYLQYFRYARGDGKSGLWPLRHLLRYTVYIFAIGLLWTAAASQSLPLLILLITLMAYRLRRPAQRLEDQWQDLSTGARLRAFLWLAPILIVGDVAKMIGYPAGLYWRWRHQPPEWRPDPAVGRF